MAITARIVAQQIVTTFTEDQPPVRLVDVIVDICVSLDQHGRNIDYHQEWAERNTERVSDRLREHLSRCAGEGQPCRFEFTSPDTFEYVNGSVHVRPGDSQELANAKLARSRLAEYRSFLRDLDNRQFEAVCVGFLEILGCSDPTLTRRSGDQGVDFYGKLELTGRLATRFHLPGPDRRFAAWLVGQAKHYAGTVSTFNLRELVGSVVLAQSGTFADDGRALSGLTIRLCDPIFYLFLTTGTLTQDSRRLADASGIIALDGEAIAATLADTNIGISGSSFSLPDALAWVDSFQDEAEKSMQS
ncbi:restriction endonuclease [Mycolicibacterium llatzerense]|uniref:restriction endonuclease n=1 Tax=Mycolicibacterium llatzerense TaxID=280871 RepID=UPI0013A6FBD1|nr:restriction endonuclease [Mycolicibacterium llatzerense]